MATTAKGPSFPGVHPKECWAPTLEGRRLLLAFLGMVIVVVAIGLAIVLIHYGWRRRIVDRARLAVSVGGDMSAVARLKVRQLRRPYPAFFRAIISCSTWSASVPRCAASLSNISRFCLSVARSLISLHSAASFEVSLDEFGSPSLVAFPEFADWLLGQL